VHNVYYRPDCGWRREGGQLGRVEGGGGRGGKGKWKEEAGDRPDCGWAVLANRAAEMSAIP